MLSDGRGGPQYKLLVTHNGVDLARAPAKYHVRLQGYFKSAVTP